ncbi:acyclic terpene utilization AtuA family protein [Hippea jasoniae]|uniref:acyclic terpene utilization AtuA family protein n=1 Tax=Hippea jasoniae TaxID=944479 RepID=UPI000551A84F|nr:acyclic terpene utilization AtuA family protein [Hippea jasoniae]
MLKLYALMGQLGYGYNRQSFDEAIKEGVDFIGVDAGSIDSGPYFLGSGNMKANYEATRNDLEYPLKIAVEKKIPFVVGSAGYAGADIHLKQFLDVVKDIARDNDLKIKVAVIHSELDKDFALELLKEGRIKSYEGNPQLTEEDIKSSEHIVAQMGTCRLKEALEGDFDLIVAGRITDASIYAAYPLLKGYDEASIWHMAKIIECGALCAKPASPSDGLMGSLYEDYFILKPPNKTRRCTVNSAMAHALYENSDPFVIEEPEGVLHLENAKYEQLDDRSVKISGARWVKKEKPTYKIEGAGLKGFRTIAIMGIRNPDMIALLDDILADVESKVKQTFDEPFELSFIRYGKDGVLGDLEFIDKTHEVGLVVDVVADRQSLAHRICSVAKAMLQHYDYKGRIATGANVAFPYSPAEIDMGGVYTFNVYHIVDEDISDKFWIEEIGF